MKRRIPIVSPILEHLQGTELRLWHLVLGFVLSTGVSVWIARSDSDHSALTQRSADLVATSSEFENRVSAFLRSGMSFDALSKEQLILLEANIEQQLQAINKVIPVLRDGSQRASAEAYARVAIELRDMLGDGLSAEETQPFGAAALQLTQLRNSLLSSIA